MKYLYPLKQLISLAVFTCLSLTIMAQSTTPITKEELSKKKAELIEKYQDNEKAAVELKKFVEASKPVGPVKSEESVEPTPQPAPKTIIRITDYDRKKAELLQKYQDIDKVELELKKYVDSLIKKESNNKSASVKPASKANSVPVSKYNRSKKQD